MLVEVDDVACCSLKVAYDTFVGTEELTQSNFRLSFRQRDQLLALAKVTKVHVQKHARLSPVSQRLRIFAANSRKLNYGR